MAAKPKIGAKTTPLLLNGYALVANAGLSSVLGLVFWMLATRLYTQDQVGLGAALISSMMTISYLSQMNLSSLLVRFLPLAGQGTSRLILRSYCFAGALAALSSLAFALGVGSLSEPLEVLRDDPYTIALFVFSTVIWSLFALQDAVLTGLRKSVVVPVKNFAYSLLKIGCLVGLAVAVTPSARGIFLSWVLPLVPILLVIDLLVIRRLASKAQTNGNVSEPAFGVLLRYLGWDSIGTFALAAAFGLAPIMVTAASGVAANATFHLAWTLSYSVYLVGRSISTSLIAEGAANPARLRSLASDTLVHALSLICGAVLVFVAAAPLIMSIFGAEYVDDGRVILRALALSCIPWAITTVYISMARAKGHTKTVALVQVSTLVFYALTSFALMPVWGVFGVAHAWLISNTLVCLIIIAWGVRNGGRSGTLDWSLALAGAAARLAGSVLRHVSLKKTVAEFDDVTLLRELDIADADNFVPKVVAGSQSDVTAIILEPNSPANSERFVLKTARSRNGQRALRRNSDVLAKLHEDSRLRDYLTMLPKVQQVGQSDALHYSLETAIPGCAGHNLLYNVRTQAVCVAQAVSLVRKLHQTTSRHTLIGDDWAKEWIDTPLSQIADAKPVILKGAQRRATCKTIRTRLFAALKDREVPLGLGHGDLWAGNVFYIRHEADPHAVELAGLIDWDTARETAPPGWDATHLAITLRMHHENQELGMVVSTLLKEGAWRRPEFEWLGFNDFDIARTRPSDPQYQWAMILLAWLHHVTANLQKSDDKDQNPLWAAANIDRVLMAASENPVWSLHEQSS